jgi:tetratricopeptide (TPR) repeat protein
LLGDCYQDLTMHPEARAAYQNAQQLAPDDPHIQLALIGLAMDDGDDTAVETGSARLLAMAPDMPEVHYQQGVWLASKGRFESARAALEKALQLSPDYYQAALYYAYITPLALDSPLVVRLKQASTNQRWAEPGQGCNVHFALGYVFDKDGQYEIAFQHYLEANRLERGMRRYSTDSHRQFQRSILDALGSPFQKRSPAFANPSDKPLFIVGLPRSGTSLLEQILSSHPQVHGGGEMLYLHAELRRRLGPVGHGDFARSVAGLPDSVLTEIAAGLLAHMHGLAPDKLRVTDKMPSNLTILGLIHGLFPNARIVYCRRDPLDTCVSCFTTSFKSGNKFSNDLKELGEYYRISEVAMEQWRSMFPDGSVHDVRYEDLVADMPGETRKLLAFCGLEWDDACLNFQDNSRAVSTASVYQVRQPIYNSAIGRWRRYASHLAPLQEALASPALL